mgnify:CR=1 FL=1
MISFIIPTLNEEKIIEETLLGLKKYSGENEIIVSDGKSTDKTVEIARKYADQVALYQGEARQTIAAGRNAGAALARGEYLVFMDADISIPDPNVFFGKVLKILNFDNNITGLTVRIRVLPALETPADRIVFLVMDYVHFVLNNIFKIGAATGEFQMVRSSAFKKTGGYNEKLVAGEDHEFFQRLSKISKTRMEKSLTAYHPGRRAHRIGWPKLLLIWLGNALSFLFKKKSMSKIWTEIR